MAQTVRELKVGIYLDGVYLAVVEARTQRKKDGTPYLRGRLRDASGCIDAVVWDGFEAAKDCLVAGQVVKARGRVGEAFGGGGLELTIDRLRIAAEGEYEPTAFLPRSSLTDLELASGLQRRIDSLAETHRAVVRAALEPELERFARFPAAQELHHAWRGGLLEHCLEVAAIAESIAGAIGGLDHDLLIAGSLLHDVGKLDAYDVGVIVRASDDGRLLGHILTGYHRVKDACDAVSASADLARTLLHIVASHHGRLEYGAAREPMIAEAIVIHFADELSAQLMQIRGAIAERSDPAARWTDRVKGLKRDVFIGAGSRGAGIGFGPVSDLQAGDGEFFRSDLIAVSGLSHGSANGPSNGSANGIHS